MKHLFLFLAVFVLISCSDTTDDDMTPVDPLPEDPISEDPKTFDTWTGDLITFSKAAEADPSQAENQDQITGSVSITRGNNGGEIYNIVNETSATQGSSPSGTKWAQGKIEDVEDLTFVSFRSAVGSPKQVVGKDLVMYIEQEDIYLSVKFLSWGANKSGAFSYERSTED